MLFICSACHCRCSSRGRCCNIWFLSAVCLLQAWTLYPHSLVSNKVHYFLLSFQELPRTDACDCPWQGPLISNRGLMSLLVRSPLCASSRLFQAPFSSLSLCTDLDGFVRGGCLMMKAVTELCRKPWNLCSQRNLEFWKEIGFKAWVVCHTAKGVCCIYHALSITNTPSVLQDINWQLPALQHIPLMEKQTSHQANQHKAKKARRWVDAGSRPTSTDQFFSVLFLWWCCNNCADGVQPAKTRHVVQQNLSAWLI